MGVRAGVRKARQCQQTTRLQTHTSPPTTTRANAPPGTAQDIFALQPPLSFVLALRIQPTVVDEVVVTLGEQEHFAILTLVHIEHTVDDGNVPALDFEHYHLAHTN